MCLNVTSVCVYECMCACVYLCVCVCVHVMGWVWRSENFYPVDSRDQIQVVRLGGRALYLTALKVIFLWECGCVSEDVKVIWTKQKWEVTFTNHVATIESLKPEELPGNQAWPCGCGPGWWWPTVFGSRRQLWELGEGCSARILDGNEQGLNEGLDHWEWGEGLLPAAQTASHSPRWPSFSVSPSSGAPLGHHFCPHRRL